MNPKKQVVFRYFLLCFLYLVIFRAVINIVITYIFKLCRICDFVISRSQPSELDLRIKVRLQL
jgi:hypothetical protein